MTAANECVLLLRLYRHQLLEQFGDASALWLYSVCSVPGGAHCECRGSSQALGVLFSAVVTKQGHSCKEEGSRGRAATFGTTLRHQNISSSVAAPCDPGLSHTGVQGITCACHSHPGTSPVPQGWRKSFGKALFPWGNSKVFFGWVTRS